MAYKIRTLTLGIFSILLLLASVTIGMLDVPDATKASDTVLFVFGMSAGSFLQLVTCPGGNKEQ